ncbi:MAG TPA: dihydrodipicolinate synthase family protein [Lacunisphaera sp.]
MSKPLTVRHHTRSQLRGYAIVPLMTPVTAGGQLDESALARLVNHIIDGGCQGLMVCGTTGEFASMSVAQRGRTVQLALAAARGRALVFGGIGDTSLENALALSQAFLAAGVDAVVANLPSYYPLTAEMMERYFTQLADGVGGPLYLYNIPQTTRLSIPLDVIERLSRHPRIAGIKDSEPDTARQEQLCRMFAGRPDFSVFCGTVPFTAKAMRAGADGFVPSGGNLAPRAARDLMDQLVGGDLAAGDAAQLRIDAINAIYQKGRTITQSLAALKGALELAGLCGRHMLSPNLPVTDAELEAMRAPLREQGLIK